MNEDIITIRLRTRIGTFRFQVNINQDISQLYIHANTLIHNTLNLYTQNNIKLPQLGKSIKAFNIRHGDLIRVEDTPNAVLNTDVVPDQKPTSVPIDPLDAFLEKENGLIQRKKDPRFCRHGDRGMCEYCSPLEPFDSQYMEDKKIKHMSFHAYLRKLTSSATRQSGDALVHPLNPVSCKVMQLCPNAHPPWPEGICSKCQPSALTLTRQSFRMVDHVEFDGPHLIDSFLSAWRKSGCQRFAYLYGKYKPYPLVPLGIKTIVSALYEPPQTNAGDGLALHHVIGTTPSNTSKESDLAVSALASADKAAALLGLVRVGMIFTDLVDDGSGLGTVECKRHAKSFYLSGMEVRLAAHMQNVHPLKTNMSPTTEFGSRFVTCVVSGNTSNGIEVEAWQVSEQACALVSADLVCASTAPNKLVMKPSSAQMYVPDVLFQERNSYGTNVMHLASPSFPIDYLLVNVTHGFLTTESNPMFPSTTYPMANRGVQSESSLASVVRHDHSSLGADGGVVEPDFALFEHIVRLGIVPDDELTELARHFLDLNGVGVPLTRAWATLASILPAVPASNPTLPNDPLSGGNWDCVHCTFHNVANVVDCEMCSLPRY